MPAELEDVYRYAVGDYTSERTVQNKYYELRAFAVLGFADDNADTKVYAWLCREQTQKGVAQGRFYRKTILTELGRIADDEVLRLYAKLICELKPKAQESVQMLRRWRIGG
jgi:hypothetical protein